MREAESFVPVWAGVSQRKSASYQEYSSTKTSAMSSMEERESALLPIAKSRGIQPTKFDEDTASRQPWR
jgi:hypothetical protein